VSQNYLENKSHYFGIGNFNEEGFAYTEKLIPMKREMFKKAMTVTGLKLLMGTDAGAGAHGRSAEEIIYRVQVAGQPARDALVGTTSLNAQSLGLADRIGALASGLDATDRGRRSAQGHALRQGLRDEGRLAPERRPKLQHCDARKGQRDSQPPRRRVAEIDQFARKCRHRRHQCPSCQLPGVACAAARRAILHAR
jgi:hypothetical protein